MYSDELDAILSNKSMKQRDYDWLLKRLKQKVALHKALKQLRNRLDGRKGPKKPKTAWQAYLEFFCKENPTKKRKENMKDAAEKWNTMTWEDRQVFIKVSNEDKVRYSNEKKNYVPSV